MHFFLSTREAKVDRYLWVRGHPLSHCEFQTDRATQLGPDLRNKIIKNEAKNYKMLSKNKL